MMLTGLILSAATLLAAADFEVQTLDGQTAAGAVGQLNARELVLETAEGPRTFALGTLAVVTRKPAAEQTVKANAWIDLVDGSSLVATQYTVKGKTARLTLLDGQQLELPTRNVAWVRFAAASDPKLLKQWREITQVKTASDLLVVQKNEALDYLEGVIGDLDADTCQFKLDGEDIPVKRTRLAGLVYVHPNPPALPEATAQLGLLDGSRLELASLELAEGKLKIATPAGAKLTLPLESVSRLDFSSGKIAFLSDLEPESAIYTPLLGLKEEPAALRDFYQYRRDIGFEQQPLRLDGKVYRKGLSLQSRTVLAYRLPGKFRLLRATVGIDDSVRETGNVHVTIKGDGRNLWENDVRGPDPAQELEVDISGVKRLELIVDYGADLDIGDRLNFCEARVTK